MFAKDRIRRVVITSIASVALIAPMVLSGVQSSHVNASRVRSEIVRHGHNHAKRVSKRSNKKSAKRLSRREKKADSAKLAQLKKQYRGNQKKLNGLVKKNSKQMMMQMMKSGMNMNGTKAPKGLKVARHASFKKGSRITVKASHMPGMLGAKGRVAGVFNTPLYEVTYWPTNHGKVVRNHKWVIGKEIKPSRKGRIRKGERITLRANHMKNMYGAKAKIVAIHHSPAYMVNYTPNNTNIHVTNHKWLAQNELGR